MKNLFKSVLKENLSKFIWQNTALNNLHEDTKERVDELQKRSKKSALTQSQLDQIILQVDIEATNGFQKFENDFNAKKPNFTTADLDGLAKYSVGRGMTGEVYKMYRTEVMSRINDFLLSKMRQTGEISQIQAGELIEKCMKALPYRSGNIDKALKDAMTMVDEDRKGNKLMANIAKKFQNITERTKLARLMEKGEQHVKLGETFTFSTKEYTMTECEILTGAAMTQVSPKITGGLYLQNAIMLEGGKQIIAQLENGCEGNFVVIDVKEKGKDDPDPIPVVPGFEKMNWSQKIEIGDLPPDIFGDFLKLNPNMHWVEYKDLYNYMEGLPEKDLVEFQQKLTFYVSSKSMTNVQDQLRKDINDPNTPPYQKKLFEAQLKLTMGDDTNVNAGVAELDALIKDPSTPTDVLAMATDIRAQIEQQFLNEDAEALAYRDLNGLWMFRTHLVSEVNDLTGEMWITNQFDKIRGIQDDEDHTIKQNKIFEETLNELEDFIMGGQAKDLPEALALLKPAKKATDFKKAYDNFIKTEMAGTVMDKPAADISKQEMKNMPEVWLKMADELRAKGQYKQAAEVYESIFWEKFKENTTVDKVTTKEEDKIRKSVSMADIEKNLKEKKMWDESGTTTAETNNQTLLANAYDATIEQLKERKSLEKSVDETDPGTIFDKTKEPNEFKAMETYQEMMGLKKGWDVSDETWNEWSKEIAINVALIAVSGGAATAGRWLTQKALVTAARSSFGLVRTASRGIIKAGMVGTKAIEFGGKNWGRITARGLVGASMEGAVFHEVQSGLVAGDWFDWNADKARGMAMSALMFNMFRAGNNIYEKGLGKKLEGRFGTQLQVKDVFRNSTDRQILNKGVAIGRGKVGYTAIKHKLMRTAGQTLPFHVVNGLAAGVFDGDWERMFSGKEMGKNFLTLLMLAQLPRVIKHGKKPPVDPKPAQKIIEPKPKPAKKDKHIRSLDEISNDINHGYGGKGKPGFGQHHGNKPGQKYNELNIANKEAKRKMTEKSKENRANKLKNAEKNLKGVDNLKTEISNNLNKQIKEIENLAKTDPVTAKKQLKEALNKELGKLGEEKQNLVKIKQERKWTKKEEADFKRIEQTKNDIKNNIYQPALKEIDIQINLIHEAKKEAYKENKQQDEAVKKAKDVPIENLRENFESMLGEGNKIKIKVEGIERMKEFEITKVKTHNGEIVGIKARADGSPPYNFKINYVDGKINIQAPNKGKTLNWNIVKVEGKVVSKPTSIPAKSSATIAKKPAKEISGKYEVNEFGEILNRKTPAKKGESRADVLNNDALWEGVNEGKNKDNYKDIKVPVAEKDAPVVDYAKNPKPRDIDGKTRRRSPGNKVEESGHRDQKNLQDKDIKKYNN